jgi:hypothetical protein
MVIIFANFWIIRPSVFVCDSRYLCRRLLGLPRQNQMAGLGNKQCLRVWNRVTAASRGALAKQPERPIAEFVISMETNRPKLDTNLAMGAGGNYEFCSPRAERE